MLRDIPFALATAALLLLPLVSAHGDDHNDASMDMHSTSQPVEGSQSPGSYWSLSEHANLMYWHIGLEILAWVVILPIGKLD
jgi:hypothetical protein